MELDKIARKIIEKHRLEGNYDAFCISNLEEVKLSFNHWIEKFPRINPYYSVRSNNNEEILKLLRDLGVGFNCGSKNETLQVLDLNVDPKRVICSHTVKEVSFIKLLAEKGVDILTFDSITELKKIKKHHPKAKVLLRIKFDATDSIISLGTKFGCNPETEASYLIKSCKELKINLIGIAFHVGLVLTDHGVYERALNAVRILFDYAESLDMKLKFVDIGGGFIGRDPLIFDNYAKSINDGIERLFPSTEIQIIAEPGRYFVESAFSLAAQVILKRNFEDGHAYYYLNDSMFSSFLINFLFNIQLQFSVIRKSKLKHKPKEMMSTIWGSSTNPLDKIIGDKIIPEMEIGDWMIFHNMGAYTFSSTEFCRLSSKNIYQIDNFEPQYEDTRSLSNIMSSMRRSLFKKRI
ncbi:hypothetical protein ACKWTF_005537 [Chironomus riparius]